MKRLTNNVAKVRESQGMSQRELARRVGMQPSMVSRVENGRRKLTQEYVMMFARVLGCEPNDLVGGHVNPVEIKYVPRLNDLSESSWSVDTGEATEQGNLPVCMPFKLQHINGGGYKVLDNHAAALGVPKGAYAITIPIWFKEEKPVRGDIVVVESAEGRLKRYALARVEADLTGIHAIIMGEKVKLSLANRPIAMLVSVYHEIAPSPTVMVNFR